MSYAVTRSFRDTDTPRTCSEELTNKERAEKNVELEVENLEAQLKELQMQVATGEAALAADNAKIAQSGDNTEEGALLSKGMRKELYQRRPAAADYSPQLY